MQSRSQANRKWPNTFSSNGFRQELAGKGVSRAFPILKKWLAAGVLEEGEWKATEAGAVQGGSISPLLANVYLDHD